MGLAKLFNTQTLCIYESIKIFMIDKDKNFMLATLLVIAAGLYGFNNNQKLAIIDNILRFSLKSTLLASELGMFGSFKFQVLDNFDIFGT